MLRISILKHSDSTLHCVRQCGSPVVVLYLVISYIMMLLSGMYFLFWPVIYLKSERCLCAIVCGTHNMHDYATCYSLSPILRRGFGKCPSFVNDAVRWCSCNCLSVHVQWEPST